MTYVETRLSGKVEDYDEENDDEDQVSPTLSVPWEGTKQTSLLLQAVYEDQLIAVSILGRFSPTSTLALLQRLVGELTQSFLQLLDLSTRGKGVFFILF